MARRNTGSVRQKRPGVFKVTIDISKARLPTYEDWKQAVNRLRRSLTVEGTREDAERALHEMQVQADTGTLPTGKVTVNTWLDYWLKEYEEPDRRSRTVDDSRDRCGYTSARRWGRTTSMTCGPTTSGSY